MLQKPHSRLPFRLLPLSIAQSTKPPLGRWRCPIRQRSPVRGLPASPTVIGKANRWRAWAMSRRSMGHRPSHGKRHPRRRAPEPVCATVPPQRQRPRYRSWQRLDRTQPLSCRRRGHIQTGRNSTASLPAERRERRILAAEADPHFDATRNLAASDPVVLGGRRRLERHPVERMERNANDDGGPSDCAAIGTVDGPRQPASGFRCGTLQALAGRSSAISSCTRRLISSRMGLTASTPLPAGSSRTQSS